MLKSLWEVQSEREEEEYQEGRTTMVYCPPCMRHWEAPANEKPWQPRTELCPKHAEEQTDESASGKYGSAKVEAGSKRA